MSFQPVHSYLTGSPVPIPNLARHEVVQRVGYTFDTSAGYPAIPLRSFGEVLHEGQKVPFRYTIDAAGQCWLDDANGGPLRRVVQDVLVAIAKDEQTEDKLRSELGLPPRSPSWVAEAQAQGWVSPDRWAKLRDAIDQANAHLFDADLMDPEHQIECHADTLPEAYRQVCAAAIKALEALQIVVGEAIGD
jgi:hypothetical protein